MSAGKSKDRPIVPITLSAKRGTPRKEGLFVPLKIEWGDLVQRNSTSRSNKKFFSTMKNELSNLKNDVEMMIQKENNKN